MYFVPGRNTAGKVVVKRLKQMTGPLPVFSWAKKLLIFAISLFIENINFFNHVQYFYLGYNQTHAYQIFKFSCYILLSIGYFNTNFKKQR